MQHQNCSCLLSMRSGRKKSDSCIKKFVIFFFVGGCGQIRYLKFLEPERGHCLEGHVFLNLSIGARRSFEEECLYQRECVAINVGPRINDMVVCELCNSDHFQHKQDLKPRHGWTYRGTEVGI